MSADNFFVVAPHPHEEGKFVAFMEFASQSWDISDNEQRAIVLREVEDGSAHVEDSYDAIWEWVDAEQERIYEGGGIVEYGPEEWLIPS